MAETVVHCVRIVCIILSTVRNLMRLIISVIALFKILQNENHNNLCSLPHPARNSAIERLNICIFGCNYKWKPSQRVSRGTALGGSAILKVEGRLMSGISKDASL